MPPDIGGEEADLMGCEVGCFPAYHLVTNLNSTGAWQPGHRWCRPAIVEGYEGRDAKGWIHFLRHGQPWRMSKGVTLAIAHCFANNGYEHYQTPEGFCGCGIFSCTETSDALPGTPEILNSTQTMTCFIYSGFGHPPGTTEAPMHCANYGDAAPVFIMPMVGGRLHNATEVRTWQNYTEGMSAILIPYTWTSNVAVGCWAHGESSNCQDENPTSYYNAQRSRFDYMLVRGLSARIEPQTLQPPAVTDVMNRALNFLAADIAAGGDGVLHLDQLDSPRRPQPDHVNTNTQGIDGFSRAFNSFFSQNPLAFEDLPEVPSPSGGKYWANSYTKRSGCAVDAAYVITSATADASVILQRERDVDYDAGDNQLVIRPLIKVRIDIRLGIRAQLCGGDAGCTLLQDWRDPDDPLYSLPITLSQDQNNYNTLGRIPFVTGGIDQIVWVDYLGRAVTMPPLRVVWEGDISPFSLSGYDVVPDVSGEDVEDYCSFIADQLSSIVVPAMRSHQQTVPTNEGATVWGGSITIGFPES